MKGSGVLLKIADAAFILSAAHVLKYAEEMELKIGPMSHGSRTITPQDAKVGISKNLEDIDIGFVPLLNTPEARADISVLFKVTKDTAIVSDLQNSLIEEQRMPELNGISGCGMWRLFGSEDRTDRLEQWQPSWIRLVGIEHGWARRKWVKGTFIQHVISLIANTYPELRASIQLTL